MRNETRGIVNSTGFRQGLHRANVVIYNLESHPSFAPICLPLWHAVQTGSLKVVSSSITLLETLVVPLRDKNQELARHYEQFWDHEDMLLSPITLEVLRDAAHIRANVPSVRSPDAIHAATALRAEAALFLTNDPVFKRLQNLPVTLLSDLI